MPKKAKKKIKKPANKKSPRFRRSKNQSKSRSEKDGKRIKAEEKKIDMKIEKLEEAMGGFPSVATRGFRAPVLEQIARAAGPAIRTGFQEKENNEKKQINYSSGRGGYAESQKQESASEKRLYDSEKISTTYMQPRDMEKTIEQGRQEANRELTRANRIRGEWNFGGGNNAPLEPEHANVFTPGFNPEKNAGEKEKKQDYASTQNPAKDYR